ncbi:glutamine synthetase [Streptomyces sp. NPDC001933]|uniref:glutamine synthetase n=1 Tax=Streptomyces sp. NPDC001933 TaxID=3364626 RepID=UPI0036CFB55D
MTNDDRRPPLVRRSDTLSYTFAEVIRPARNFLHNEKQEWEECRSEVTAFELKTLLPVL